MRILGISAALGLAGLAAGGLGAMPARADAVGDFEQIVKPLAPSGSLSYGAATATGPTSLTLKNVVYMAPDPSGKPMKLTIDSVTIGDIDFDGIKAGQAPARLSLKLDGITPDFTSAPAADPKEAELVKMMSGLWPKTTASLAYSVVGGHLKLDDFTLDMSGLARLSLTLELDGAVTDPKNAAAAAIGTSLTRATLTYDDRSLLAKAIPLIALGQKSSDTAVLADAKAQLAALKQGVGPLSASAIDTVAALLADYQAPKGPLKIVLAPPTPPNFVTLAAKDSPDAVLTALGATITYNGAAVTSAPTTTASLPGPGGGPHARSKGGSAAPPQLASAAPAACKEGDRLFVYSDDGWYAATVRETTSRTGRCLVRYDGHGADDDEIVGPDQIMAWSPDGPGKAVGACEKDASVLGESDGVWYSATILSTQGKGCKVHWAVGDDPDEVLRLDQIRTLH